MKRWFAILAAVMLVLGGATFSGCEKKADTPAEAAKDAAKEIADETKDAAKEVGEAVKEGAEEVKDAAK